MQRLKDQVAIVTGGAQGLGGAISRRLADEGARVLIADIDLDTAEANAAGIRESGGVALALRTDVSQGRDLRQAVEEAVEQWHRLDILVNNAFEVSSAGSGGALDVPETVWQQGMDILVKAIYLGAKYAIPQMRKVGRGSIVNISSVHGLLMAPGMMVYETAKAAAIGITRQMATEFGPDGIRVNAILPGHMVTERLRSRWEENPSGLRFFADQYPLRRVGTMVDITNGAVFLCSEEASFITGHSLVIDGGLSIQLQEDFGVRQANYVQQNPDLKIPD